MALPVSLKGDDNNNDKLRIGSVHIWDINGFQPFTSPLNQIHTLPFYHVCRIGFPSSSHACTQVPIF